jgi:hypothetical protein
MAHGTTVPQVTTSRGADLRTVEPTALSKPKQTETASTVLAAQATAEIIARRKVALEYPRDVEIFRQRMLRNCERPTFAEVAMYSKPVGGKNITGESIRFVEAALREYHNVGTSESAIYEDDEKRIVRIEVEDLESNTPNRKDIVIAKTVERKFLKEGQKPLGQRRNSEGNLVYLVVATEDDMFTKTAALSSKTRRQLGLMVLPGDIVAECVEVIGKTLKDKAAKDPDGEKRKVIDAFYDIGVRVDQLHDYLGIDLDTLTPKDLVHLRAVFAAIKEGETSWQEVMDARTAALGKQTAQPGETGTRGKEILDAIGKKKEQVQADLPNASGQPVPTDTAPSPSQTEPTGAEGKCQCAGAGTAARTKKGCYCIGG